jgi:hypothetical protein
MERLCRIRVSELQRKLTLSMADAPAQRSIHPTSRKQQMYAACLSDISPLSPLTLLSPHDACGCLLAVQHTSRRGV